METDRILRYPDAVWNVSGLFVHDAAILFFYDICRYCGAGIRIMVHGNIPCMWNSGRIIQSVEPEYQAWCLKEYAKRNIPVLLTFSNYLLEEKDLKDPQSNNILMQAADIPGNGVIVSSDILCRYIRDKYPDMFMYSSILKIVSEDRIGDIDNYLKMSDTFDRVVLHPDDGLTPELLDKLYPRDRFEILINENCLRNCAFRKEHCDIVSRFYKENRPAEVLDALNEFKLVKCKSVQSPESLAGFVQGKRQTCNFTWEELKQCHDKGFRYFKIQGRSLSTASLLYDLTDYILTKPASGTIFKMIMDRLGSGTVYENRKLLFERKEDWEEI